MAKIKMSDKFDNLLIEIKERSIVTEIEQVPLTQLVKGRYQPRKSFNETAIAELAQSIKENGVLQPIIVKKHNDHYEVIAGERRWQAAKQIGLTYIPAIIKNVDDEVAATFALIENLQRADLSPLEEAEGYKQLIEKFGFTHEEIAKRVGRSRPSISNALRLLSLDKDVLNKVQEGRLDMGHARALAGLNTTEQSRVAREVINKNLNVRDTERLAYKLRNEADENDDLLSKLSVRLNKFAHNVYIKRINSERIKVSLEFSDESELKWFLDKLEK